MEDLKGDFEIVWLRVENSEVGVQYHLPILCVVGSKVTHGTCNSGRMPFTPFWQYASVLSKLPIQPYVSRSSSLSFEVGRDRLVVLKATTKRVLVNILSVKQSRR